LLRNNISFSSNESYYNCQVGPILLSIPSWSPQDKWGNRHKIKGNRVVLSSNAEKSTPGRMASHDVQILWKKVFWHYVPLQFFYIIEFIEEVF